MSTKSAVGARRANATIHGEADRVRARIAAGAGIGTFTDSCVLALRAVQARSCEWNRRILPPGAEFAGRDSLVRKLSRFTGTHNKFRQMPAHVSGFVEHETNQVSHIARSGELSFP